MKKLKLFSVFAFFALLLAGCSDSASDNSMALLLASQSGGSSKAKTLSARIAQASNGDVIDIDGEGLTVDSNAYTISKNITIKNGDLNGVSFTIADSESRSVSDLFVILEGLKGLASVDVQSGGSISITKTEITTISVSADSASLTVVSATVESLEINGEGSKLKVSSTTVSTLTVGEGVESVALGGTTEVSTLTVVNISSVEIVKTAGAIVTEAKDESGSDISGEIGEATGFLRKFVIYENNWKNGNEAFPDGQGVFTVPYKRLKNVDEVWACDKCPIVYFDVGFERGKNYKISFKAKASESVEILAEVKNNARETNNISVNLEKDQWVDVVAYSSRLFQNCDRIELVMPAENWSSDVTIQYKDFKLEETSDTEAPLIGTSAWCRSDGTYTISDVVQRSFDSDGVLTISIKKDMSARYKHQAGCNINALAIEKENLGKLHKVSYEIMVENPVYAENFIVASNVAWQEQELGYGWSWGSWGMADIPTGTWIKVIEYVPTSSSSKYCLYDDCEPINPAIKTFVGTFCENTIKVRNFQLEICDEATSMTCFWVNDEPIYHPVNIEYIDGLLIPANTTIAGKISFAHNEIWTASVENDVVYCCTNCDIFDEDYLNSIGIVLSNVVNQDYLSFKNTTSKDIYLRFNLQNGCMNFVQESNPAEDEQFVYFDPHPKPEQIIIMGRVSDNYFTYVYDGKISWSGNRFSTKIELGSDSESYSNFYVELKKKWYDYPRDSEGHMGSIIVPYGSKNAMTLGKSTVLTSYHDNGGIGEAYLPFFESGKTYTATGVWDDKTKSVTLTITE